MRILTLTLIALIVPFAAACGSSDSSTTAPAAAPGGGQSIAVTATDFHFGPPALSAEAGTVTFTLTNNGGATHALTIEGNGIEESSETIGPGDSTEMTVELAEGEYEIYCPVGGHKDMGMVGTLSVGAGSGGATTDDGGGATTDDGGGATTDDGGGETTTDSYGY